MKNITIGISIYIRDDDNVWGNGITQNAINLLFLLQNSPNNYNVMLVNMSEINNIEYDLDNVVIKHVKEVRKDLDIIFLLGTHLYNEDEVYLINKGCKLIYYCCGSSYISNTETILFDKDSPFTQYNTSDEIWVIPQNITMNKGYFEAIYKRRTIEVPFIWSPVFIDHIIKNSDKKYFYSPTNEPKRISCFEPNLGVIKFAMYDIVIVEKAYELRPELMKHFYVTNALNIMKQKMFISTMQQLNIVKNGIASFESRYRIPYFLDEFTDVVVAHQWGNPLNYAYLDCLYLNYPFVHNAHLIKDGGYYYEGFDADEGARQLIYAMEHHDENIDEYNEKSKKLLDRFLPTNQQTIETYDKLIDDLYKK